MSDGKVLRTVYVPKDVDHRIKQIAFTRGVTHSDVMRELLANGLLAFDASGERSLADDLNERHRLMIKFREDRLAELVSIIDDEFDQRFEKIKEAIRGVYPRPVKGEK